VVSLYVCCPPIYCVSSHQCFSEDTECAANCVIEVDVKKPENNREVIITQFVDVEHQGRLRDGFEILLQADSRDYGDDLYKAQQVSSNEILVEMPSMPAAYLENFEENFFTAQKDNQDAYCVELEKQHRVTVNTIKETKERQIKCLILRFPCNMIFDHPREGNKSLEVTVFHKEYTIFGQMVQNLPAFVYWRFYLYEAKERVARNVKLRSANAAKLAAALTSTKNRRPATTPSFTPSKSHY